MVADDLLANKLKFGVDKIGRWVYAVYAMYDYSINGAIKMAEVSSAHAAEIIGTSDVTIRRAVYADRLPARREGLRKKIWIDVDELRRFAAEYQYRFDEALARKVAQK